MRFFWNMCHYLHTKTHVYLFGPLIILAVLFGIWVEITAFLMLIAFMLASMSGIGCAERWTERNGLYNTYMATIASIGVLSMMYFNPQFGAESNLFINIIFVLAAIAGPINHLVHRYLRPHLYQGVTNV